MCLGEILFARVSARQRPPEILLSRAYLSFIKIDLFAEFRRYSRVRICSQDLHMTLK